MAVSVGLPPKKPYLARTATRYGPVISDRSTYKPFYASGGHGHGGGPPMAFHGVQMWAEENLDFPLGEASQVGVNITVFDTDNYIQFEDGVYWFRIGTGMAGVYYLWGFARVESTSGAYIDLYVTKNTFATPIYTTLPIPDVSTDFTISCSGFIELEEGDELRLFAFNGSDFDSLLMGTEFIPVVFGIYQIGVRS